MEILYHIRPYLVGIFPYIGLIIALTYGRYLQFRFLKWPLIKLRALFGDQTLHLFFAILFPPRPSLSTSDPRFKIQDPKKSS